MEMVSELVYRGSFAIICAHLYSSNRHCIITVAGAENSGASRTKRLGGFMK